MFGAGERSRKLSPHVNRGAPMHGMAQGRMKPFLIPKPGGAWLQRGATAMHQWGSSETPTGSFDPILGSSSSPPAQGP